MSAQRILFLVTQAHWGGAQDFIVHLTSDFVRDGRTVLLAAGGEGDLWQKAAALDIPTHKLKHVVRDVNLKEDLLGTLEIRELIRTWRPDVIHLNSSKMSVIGGFAALGLKHRPRVVYCIGGWAFLEPSFGKIKQAFYLIAEIITAKLKDTIITVHPGDAVLGRAKHIRPRKQLVAVPNGLDVTSFVAQLLPRKEAREALQIPEHAFVYGTVANAYPAKGLVSYVKVLERVLQKDAGAYAVIIGGGEQLPQLQRMVEASPVKDRLFLTGFRGDAARLYGAFDVFVLPSRKEGMPLSILEAFGARRPVVATDVGACRWMIEDPDSGNKAGIVVPPNDPLALEEALQKIRIHSDERESYAREAFNMVNRRFSWKSVYTGHRDIIDA